jgi:peptidoglycan/LPS O-acetylase OafA/YrhL
MLGRVQARTVPAAVAPPPGNPRFPLLDGLRAIAALTVFVFHVGLASEEHHGIYTGLGSGFGYQLLGHLDWGVTIFFLIAGFLLYRPFVAARYVTAPATPVRTFLRRRVLRVVPAYWLALTVLAIYPGLGLTVGNAWWFYGFVHIYSRNTSYAGLAVSWTLCVEPSFYVLLPWYSKIMAYATQHLPSTNAVRRELIVLAAFAAIALLLQVYITDGGHTTSLFFLTRTLPLCLDWFALGMGLAVLSVVGPDVTRSAVPLARRVALNGSAWWWAAAAGLWLACVVVENYRPYQPLRHALYGAAAFCLLVPAVFGERGVVSRVLSARWIAWLGLISYGIYLWQLRLLLLFHDWGLNAHNSTGGLLLLGVSGLAATLAFATASYYLFGRPILRFKYRGRAVAPSRGDEVAIGATPD